MGPMTQHRRHLNHAVPDARNAERPLASVALRYPHPQEGLGEILSRTQLLPQRFQPATGARVCRPGFPPGRTMRPAKAHRTIEPRIRFSRRGGGSARCSGSRARVQPRNFFPRTPPSTTFLTPSAISLRPKRTTPFALGDDHVANSSRSSPTISELKMLRARPKAM
jgi:hypothetical protein